MKVYRINANFRICTWPLTNIGFLLTPDSNNNKPIMHFLITMGFMLTHSKCPYTSEPRTNEYIRLLYCNLAGPTLTMGKQTWVHICLVTARIVFCGEYTRFIYILFKVVCGVRSYSIYFRIYNKLCELSTQ